MISLRLRPAPAKPAVQRPCAAGKADAGLPHTERVMRDYAVLAWRYMNRRAA